MAIHKKSLIFFLSVLFCFIPLTFVSAASISTISDVAEVVEGQSFNVNVYVNTQGEAINNADGVIYFPTDLLSVDSVGTIDSIFNIWVEQPSFSNSGGTITFNGGVPNPGYIGARGKVLTIRFKAKASGIAQISFVSASIRANDGLGTDITSQKTGSSVTIKTTSSPTPVITNNPSAPIISSDEMSNSDKWYNLTSATFYWPVANDINAAQLLLGQYSDSVPSVTYEPAISRKTLTDLTDGVWYLHVRLRNASGWGKITHRRIAVDTTPPSSIQIDYENAPEDLTRVSLNAKDETSGIARYEIKVDGETLTEIDIKNGNAEVSSTLPAFTGGKKDLTVRAYDKAGNVSEKTISIDAPEQKAPIITSYSKEIKEGEKINIKGKAFYADAQVAVWIKEEGKKEEKFLASVNDDNSFEFTSATIDKKGLITVWVETERNDGKAKSISSDKVFVNVDRPTYIQFGLTTINILSILVPIIALLAIAWYFVFLASYRIKRLKKIMHRDLDAVERDIEKIMDGIQGDIKQYSKILGSMRKKGKLSEEEKEIFDTISQKLENAENYFQARLQKIEDKNLIEK